MTSPIKFLCNLVILSDTFIFFSPCSQSLDVRLRRITSLKYTTVYFGTVKQ